MNHNGKTASYCSLITKVIRNCTNVRKMKVRKRIIAGFSILFYTCPTFSKWKSFVSWFPTWLKSRLRTEIH